MTKTLIFKDYQDFSNRPYKLINGVSEEFAKDNPDYEEDNKTNEACWDCHNCNYCYNCNYGNYCNNCRYCSFCSFCRDCSEKEGNEIRIPLIESIRKKVFEALRAKR